MTAPGAAGGEARFFLAGAVFCALLAAAVSCAAFSGRFATDMDWDTATMVLTHYGYNVQEPRPFHIACSTYLSGALHLGALVGLQGLQALQAFFFLHLMLLGMSALYITRRLAGGILLPFALTAWAILNPSNAYLLLVLEDNVPAIAFAYLSTALTVRFSAQPRNTYLIAAALSAAMSLSMGLSAAFWILGLGLVFVVWPISGTRDWWKRVAVYALAAAASILALSLLEDFYRDMDAFTSLAASLRSPATEYAEFLLPLSARDRVIYLFVLIAGGLGVPLLTAMRSSFSVAALGLVLIATIPLLLVLRVGFQNLSTVSRRLLVLAGLIFCSNVLFLCFFADPAVHERGDWVVPCALFFLLGLAPAFRPRQALLSGLCVLSLSLVGVVVFFLSEADARISPEAQHIRTEAARPAPVWTADAACAGAARVALIELLEPESCTIQVTGDHDFCPNRCQLTQP